MQALVRALGKVVLPNRLRTVHVRKVARSLDRYAFLPRGGRERLGHAGGVDGKDSDVAREDAGAELSDLGASSMVSLWASEVSG